MIGQQGHGVHHGSHGGAGILLILDKRLDKRVGSLLRLDQCIKHQFEGIIADGGLLVRGGENGVTVIEGLHHIPDKVHELIGFGLAGETADLHNTAQGVDKHILRSRVSRFSI